MRLLTGHMTGMSIDLLIRGIDVAPVCTMATCSSRRRSTTARRTYCTWASYLRTYCAFSVPISIQKSAMVFRNCSRCPRNSSISANAEGD